MPVGVTVEDVDRAGLDVAVHANRHTWRHRHLEVADPDPRGHVSLTAGEADVREVELQLADPELVLAVEVVGGRRDVAARADPVPDVDVEGGRDRGRCGKREDDHDRRGDREALEHAPPTGPALRPQDDRAGDEDERPRRVAARPKGRPREQDGERRREEAEADHLPRLLASLAQRLRRDGLRLALVGDHEHRREVDENAGTAEQREHDEAHPIERGAEVEVAREAPADPREHAVGAAPLEPLHRRFGCDVLGHVRSIARPGTTPLSGMTLSRP